MRFSEFTSRFLKRLQGDTYGTALSTELILVATVVLIGLATSSTALRDAVISELSDVGGAVQDLQGCYSVNGLRGHSSHVAGMSYGDSLDHCDNSDDAPGVADNCIVFDGPPTNEIATVIAPDELVTSLSFDGGDASDTSPFGSDNSGVAVGDPNFTDGVVEFDGDDAIYLPNSDDINLGIHEERTITLTFNADDVTSTQVLYEEGATVRGLVIYIDDGMLYIGGWNIPDGESGWDPEFISVPISAGVDNTVSLVLDGDATVQPDALSGYLNGALFGSAPGSQLWQHGGGIGIGGTNGRTNLHTGSSSDDNFFTGTIDDVSIFNRVLTDAELAAPAQ